MQTIILLIILISTIILLMKQIVIKRLEEMGLALKNIAQGEGDRIFDRFYRGDVSRNRKREGFGLGLSLSREIARAHRGELKLDTTPKGETAFTLILPAAKQRKD